MARFSSDEPGWVDPLPDDDETDIDELPDARPAASSAADDWPVRNDPRRPRTQTDPPHSRDS